MNDLKARQWTKNKGKKPLWPLFMDVTSMARASRLEPLQWGSLLFTTKFPDIPGTHFIDLGRMKGWVDLGPNQWFWTRDPWIRNPAPQPLGQCSIYCSSISKPKELMLETMIITSHYIELWSFVTSGSSNCSLSKYRWQQTREETYLSFTIIPQ